MGQIQNTLTGAVGSAVIAGIGYENRIQTQTTAAAKGIAQLREGGEALRAEIGREERLQQQANEYLEKHTEVKKAIEEGTEFSKLPEKTQKEMTIYRKREAAIKESQAKQEVRSTELINLKYNVKTLYDKLPARARAEAQIGAAAITGMRYSSRRFADIPDSQNAAKK